MLNRLNNNINVMNSHPVFRRSVSLSPSRMDGIKYREALAPVRTLIRESFKVFIAKILNLTNLLKLILINVEMLITKFHCELLMV